MLSPLADMYPRLQVSEGKQVFSIKHIVRTHSFGILISSDNGGNPPQIQVPILQSMAKLPSGSF